MPPQVSNGMKRKELIPFRMGTRQRRRKVGQVAYGASTVLPLVLDRVGYLSRLIVQFRGTVTLSAAGAFSDLGPWNLVQRLRLLTNIGAANIADVSGFGSHISGRLQSEGMSYDKAGIGDTVPSADVFSAPLAMGANTWNIPYDIPVSVNYGREFEFGLINLQSPETQVTLEIQTGPITDAAALITAITGAFHVYAEYYEVPQPDVFSQPPLALARLLEETIPVTGTGELIYTLPRMGVWMSAINVLRLNGARSDSFDSHALRLNKTDTAYLQERQWTRIVDRRAQLLNAVTGVFATDLYQSDMRIGTGDARDCIDTEELATVEQIVNISSGAVLGANNNFLTVVRRIAQRLDR